MKILDIYKNILLEDFKSQRKKFIEQGYSSDIVDTYLKDFDEIRNGKFREARDAEINGLNVPKGEPRFNVDNYKTFRELEILVDYIAGQRKVGSANFENIVVDGEPIFRNEDVEIYYADTPRACIQYKGDFPYSWCVARNDSGNLFYDYRLRDYEPAFYFVKLIKRIEKEFSFWDSNNGDFDGVFKDKYHFFVVQVTNYNEYIVTSAENDGDISMDWYEISELAPELSELNEVFQPKPLTKEERKKIEKYQNGLSDDEFAKLPYKEKDLYMSVYKGNIERQILTNRQFDVLPEDLKNKYIGFRVGLSNEQYKTIKNNKNLLKRYSDVTKKKFAKYIKDFSSHVNFTYSEQLFIQDEIKNLIDTNVVKINIDRKINLISLLHNPDEQIDKIINENSNLLHGEYILKFVRYAVKKEKYVTLLLNRLNNGEEINLQSSDIQLILTNTTNIDEVAYQLINLLYDKNNNINNIYYRLDTYLDIILRNSYKKDELIDYVINLVGSYLNRNYMGVILKYTSKIDERIDSYINIKGEDIQINLIAFLPYEFVNSYINKYINIKGHNLDYHDAEYLRNSGRLNDELVYKIINRIGDNKIPLQTSAPTTILGLLHLSKNKDEIIEHIINTYEKHLTHRVFEVLLDKTSKKDELINKYINLKGRDLKFLDFEILMKNLSNKEETIDKIINVKADSLNVDDIYYFLTKTNDKYKLIDKLIEMGFSKESINGVIFRYNMSNRNKLSFVNEDELNEKITRIKSIITLL